MKYPYETEEEFIARQKEARSRGECVCFCILGQNIVC